MGIAEGSNSDNVRHLHTWTIDIQSSTSTQMARIKEFQDTEHVPDLSKEEIGAIEEAGSKLHQRIFVRHIIND